MKEPIMERFHRVMAKDCEWYANNLCRNEPNNGFLKLARYHRRKLEQLRAARKK